MKCYIIGAGEFKYPNFSFEKNDFIIAVDGGYIYAKEYNLPVNLLIGDFDSMENTNTNVEKIVLPKEKNETDTYVAICEAVKRGYKEIILLGCMGKRLEHTIANIQILVNFTLKGINIKMMDNNSTVFILIENNEYYFDEVYSYISVFSYSPSSTISIKGLKYDLEKYTLDNSFPLGIDNEPLSKKGYLKIYNGIVLVITSINN